MRNVQHFMASEGWQRWIWCWRAEYGRWKWVYDTIEHNLIVIGGCCANYYHFCSALEKNSFLPVYLFEILRQTCFIFDQVPYFLCHVHCIFFCLRSIHHLLTCSKSKKSIVLSQYGMYRWHLHARYCPYTANHTYFRYIFHYLVLNFRLFVESRVNEICFEEVYT